MLETTRTTSQTMRMEHKTNFPDLPITFSQRTQTPTIPLKNEGTMVDHELKRETKSQTESTQTQSEPQRPTAPLAQSIPFPFIDTPDSSSVQPPEPIKKSALEFFESNLKNLPALQDEKYTRYEDLVKGNKTYVHKQNVVKDQFHSKLNEDLSYFNLVPEPPPEMGFMPKVQQTQPERIVEKVKKLEEVHQTNETPLSGTVFPQNYKKEEKFEKKEFSSTKTVSTSPFVQQKPTTPLPHRPYTPQMNRDKLFTPDPNLTRSASPKPSMEAVNMEKLWSSSKIKSPEPYSQQHQQQNFSHEQKSSFVAYSSSQQSFSQQHESLPSTEHFVPIQPYNVEPQNQEEMPKASIKDTKSFFEQRIKQEEVKSLPTDLKAPGLVRQFAKPMVPLIPLDIEPGSPPEMCYAPKPVYERKQSYVEKIEKTLEQNIEKEPERVPRGGVRIFPQRSMSSQSPQRAQTAPSPKPVLPAAPAVIHHIVKPEPIVPQQLNPKAEPFVPSFEQYQSKEFKSEHFEIKNESSSVENKTSYRHVEPPKFLQQAKLADPLPPVQFEMPKLPEPFNLKPEPAPVFVHPTPVQQHVPKPLQQQPRVVPIQHQQAPRMAPVQQQPPREVPIAIQKPEPTKPILQQHKPVSQPKPYMQAKPKFSELFTDAQGTHSLYKNFVKSEESTHSTESYFQKIEQSKLSQMPQQQFMKQEPPKQQFVPPPQQVRKKYLPDVML